MLKVITSTIAKKEHLSPSEVENWCLPDITVIYSIYLEEMMELNEATKDIDKDMPSMPHIPRRHR